MGLRRCLPYELSVLGHLIYDLQPPRCGVLGAALEALRLGSAERWEALVTLPPGYPVKQAPVATSKYFHKPFSTCDIVDLIRSGHRINKVEGARQPVRPGALNLK
jgi:hypothetical protein